MDPMRIDCQTCPVRGLRCDSCVVTALAALPMPTVVAPADDQLALDAEDRTAIERFVATGLLSAQGAMAAYAERDDVSWRQVAG